MRFGLCALSLLWFGSVFPQTDSLRTATLEEVEIIEKYTAMVQPNALSNRSVPPRFYYPGAPVQFYGMLHVSYRL